MALAKWISEKINQLVTLPSEAEWEKAARGGISLTNGINPLPKRQYPWGDSFDSDKCNTSESGIQDTNVANKHPNGASPYGVLEMIGNVWEWTRSVYKPYPYLVETSKEISYDPHVKQVVRGGSWYLDATWARCTARESEYPNRTLDDHGFRLVIVV